MKKAGVYIPLPPEVISELQKEWKGGGGFQGLARALQDSLDPDGGLFLDLEMIRKISVYANDYGDGGFQKRLRPLYDTLCEMAELLKAFLEEP